MFPVNILSLAVANKHWKKKFQNRFSRFRVFSRLLRRSPVTSLFLEIILKFGSVDTERFFLNNHDEVVIYL